MNSMHDGSQAHHASLFRLLQATVCEGFQPTVGLFVIEALPPHSVHLSMVNNAYACIESHGMNVHNNNIDNLSTH